MRIMNTFTPMIESALDGPQLKQQKKALIMALCGLVLGLGVSFYAASSVRPVNAAPKKTAAAEVLLEDVL